MNAAVPTRVRVAFAHAALAWLADQGGFDVLHIKGAAAHPSFDRRSGGTDADVLVRPSQVAGYLAALRRNGWRELTTFATDSDFGSAATFRHELWGYADVHRFFPGFGGPFEAAFDRLWRDREVREIAGYPCPVPDVVAPSVILVLNAARTGGSGARAADLTAVWDRAPAQRRHAMSSLVADLGAQVAFAAGTGDLERFRGSRQYRLWRIESQGGASRAAKWAARIWAAPSIREACRLGLRLPLVNVDHLAMILGRRPTRSEVLREFWARPARGVGEGLRIGRERVARAASRGGRR